MRSFITFASCLALTAAQSIDMDVVLSAATVPAPSIPVVYNTATDVAGASMAVATATTVAYNPTAAAAAVSKAIAADPSDAFPLNPTLAKRVGKRAATSCVAQPTGIPYHPKPDSPSAFQADPYFSSVAVAAPTPTGYTNTFTNTNARSDAYGYLGYTLLNSYDVVACSQKCDATQGCSGINIFFERGPSVNPDNEKCSNPPSNTQIKCVLWGGPVSTTNSDEGEKKNQFNVVYAGSNGYVKDTLPSAPGYAKAVDLGTSTLNAPLDCSGHDTYMGVKFFNSGPFDIRLCAAACSEQSVYNLAHPPNDRTAQTCQFFTSYLLYKNGDSVGQYCAMYSMTWSQSYATNTGYYYGDDHYTIGMSYAMSNATDFGGPYSSCTAA